MESAKHWELPGEELGTGTRKSENHLNRGIYCISSFVPHSNSGSKSTKFDESNLVLFDPELLWGTKDEIQ
jgi:hypothetical protein